MTDTPGRLLSSLSNTDGKPPKVGGCVGVFFQLFDWNRRLSGKHLFSTKSLPAERPPSNKFNDEKLPMAKLLLIADENRGVHSNSESQSEFGSEKSSEYGSSKKPGIVARLMGLESLPEAEVQTKETFFKQQSQEKHRIMQQYQELQMMEDLLQKRPDELRKIRREMESSPGNKVRVEEKMPKNARKDQDPMQKFAKLPLSPKKSGIPFASILSPSKSSNKVAPPIKSQNSHRRTALLMGAAARILEPGIQASRSRPLLENAPGATENSSSSAKSGGNRVYAELRKSLPKTNKQAPQQQKPKEQQEVQRSSGLTRGPGSLLPCKTSSKSGSKAADRGTPTKSTSSKPQQQSPRLEEVVTACEVREDGDDDSLSDSQASSSKENRIIVSSSAAKLQKVVGPPKLSRSGSVKEEQPPTPPSRGSLFRSKSVREEVQSSPQPLQPTSQQESSHSGGKSSVSSTTTPVSGGKEVRLKREKREKRQGPISLQETSTEVGAQKPRKPPLDQRRTAQVQRGNLQEQPQEQQKSKTSRQIRNAQEEKDGKSSSLLSYDRLFKTRKQPKSSSPKEGETSKTNNNSSRSSVGEKQASKKLSSSKDEESVKPQPNKNNDNSLMKSLLRRKPLNKAETVSSSKKKAMECPKQQRSSNDHIQHAYERQTRSGGSSPGRNLKETSKRDVVSLDVTKDWNRMNLQEDNVLEEPVLDVSPEKVQAVERMHFEPDMIADKSLEEILKTILSKSLGKTSIGDSPLSGKKSSSFEMSEEVANEDDGNVIDMELSPIEPQSRFEIDQTEDLPCKVLQFEDDEKHTTATPLALPSSDAEANSKTGTAEVDGGQPSPVSVLDFSALQSPFPSEVTTSCEELDDDSKRVLESDADSIFTGSDHQVLVGSISDCKANLDLESYSSVTSCFPDFPEVGVEEAASCEGQEIEFYVREVLVASGFTGEEVDETPSTVPCTEEIFQRLDKQLAIQQEQQGMVEFVSSSDSSQVRCLEAPGSCHKLMHECIAEALDLVLDPFRDDNRASSIIASSSSVILASSSSSSIAQRPLGEDLVAEVSSFILSWREMTLGMVDELVEVDMSTEGGKWRALTSDSIEIGVDLERMIFRSVMEDLIADLVGSRLMSGGARKREICDPVGR
ncbi:hypothetical protein SELMODRAFT_443543 [Selaginella moellendorffii]|uniref:DUF4378 domain-containing protein n=1 Tax=Selaginella moellendorffii TaxID=88036 RepID=D8S240_SELML|nr:uncharacterized protein LOC9655785 [Selaginella moellendorffii]EFJ21563.1 hypothetical protein SELMODRAFT_443543 [Selaginella moellendorffii]|eukprot:XP_002977559.1 uncharacterized protein LOC9655785 [Selaginella moellendorffii]